MSSIRKTLEHAAYGLLPDAEGAAMEAAADEAAADEAAEVAEAAEEEVADWVGPVRVC
jgi:hypothetical protein